MRAGMARLRYPGSEAEQLLLAPQDLRTADPSFSTEIYSGHFGLAGTYAELDGLSPFGIQPPSEAWERELHGFGWLRHLRAADSQLAREQAKTLFRDWVRFNRHVSVAWRPDVVGRRVISWLSNSVVVLDVDDAQSYESFLRELTAQLRYLSASYSDAPDGLPRLQALMALIYAGLCLADQQAVVDRYVKRLNRELDRQILADGGHITRNPIALVELLLDLLPLRQCFVARDRLPPDQLVGAIDRAMLALRLFRYRDGSLPRFNGTGVTPADALATVLAYDDSEAMPPEAAPESAYGRIERGGTMVFFDYGAAPAKDLSLQAQAGCLSFEMMSDDVPVIVNCGAPPAEFAEWREFARSTDAHSTLSIDDQSSGVFSGYGPAVSPEADVTLAGPPDVSGSIEQEGNGIEIRGFHSGYGPSFGLGHTRVVNLAPTGALISGKDVLSPIKSKRSAGTPGEFAIRFHLHPDVAPEMSGDGRSVTLKLSNGEIWRISSNAPSITLEESVFFGDERGVLESWQVVLSGKLAPERETRTGWSIERLES
jgi:uncharacterized heparinase superfamily protein